MEKKPIMNRIAGLISRHPAITLSCAVTGALCAAAYLHVTPSLYQAQTSIQVPNVKTGTTTISLFNNTSTSPVAEEMASESFLTQAFEKQPAQVRTFMEQDFRKTETTSRFPYTISFRQLGEKYADQTYILIPLASNTYRLESSIGGITRYKTGIFGKELIDRDLAITIAPKQKAPWKPEPLITATTWSFTIQPPASAAQELLRTPGMLEVAEENGVVTVSVKQENPERAKAMIRSIMENYMVKGDPSGNAPGSPVASLDARLEQLGNQLMATEAKIASYKKEHQVSDITFDTEKSLAQLKDLQMQKTQLEINLAALDNLSMYLRKNRDGNNSLAEYGALQDPVFSEQLNLLNQKYELRKTAQNPALDSEIEQLKNVIAERLLNTRKKTSVQIDQVNQAIAQARYQLGTLPEKANTLMAMNRELQVHQKVYDLLVEKRAEALVTGSGASQAIRILRPVTVSATPVNLTPWLAYLIGIISGVLGGAVISRIREIYSRNRITSREELTGETRIPFLGSVTFSDDRENVSEMSYQNLCTRVLMMPDTKIITFASTGKGEGKTFIATRFAQALAAMDKKVLIVDMNQLNPEVSDYFDLTPERTMSDVLEGTCDIHDAVSITSHPNCDVLVCGSLPSGINSLLASRKRETIFADLKKHYDYIVMDTPETGMVIDAIPMMTWSDLTLYVVRANTTRKQSLHVAEQIRTDYGINNLFLVLNASKTPAPTASNQRRSRDRNKIRTIQPDKKPSFVPEVLRKIALWFY